MRNPLIKRLPRELKSELGKYIVLFIFLTTIIGFISGFFVAANSLKVAYDEGFEKYNIEDGNFELYFKAEDTLIETLEKDGVRIYENFYIEKETDNVDSTLRIYKNRQEIDRVSLMEGKFPARETEIAIDRMYADNNDISLGDTLSVDGYELTVSGLVALSDYSCLFASPSDMMFDAFKFGVAVMTEEGFNSLGDNGFHFNYSWKYVSAPADDTRAKEMSEDVLETLTQNAIVTNFIPGYSNPAIQFTDEDMTNDRVMFMAFLYIVISIIAFIFAITTSNTITKEATVIGTLRASGYTKGEIIRHYMAIPMLVILVSALVGNLLGYTYFKKVAVGIYYTNYSLPTFVTLWNADAFLRTTVVPVILMFVINLFILVNKLSLSPLNFIRRNLSKKQKKKAFRLNTKIAIMTRFRLRIIFQNMPNYITIVIGIFFANVILLLGMGFPELLKKYQNEITENMICDYQYVLKTAAETKNDGAEKYCAAGLKTIEGTLKSEDVSIFGIVPDSQYIDLDFTANDVYISNAFSEKYSIDAGDTITLKEEFGNTEYIFYVEGIYDYPNGIAVFMSQEFFNETFDKEADYFNGYFTNEELEDIDDMFVATKITEDDLNKMSRQLTTSMGSIFEMFFWFGLVMFMLIIYLLSKIVIEKNAPSISMTKILGYTNREINGLYIMSTSMVVIASFLLTMPIVNELMRYVCRVMLSEYSGWLPYYVPFSVYVKIIVAGIIAYALIAFLQFRRVKRIPLDVALKNVE